MSTIIPTPAAALGLDADELTALAELVRHSRDPRLVRGPRSLRDALNAHREPDWIRDRTSFAAWATAFHPPVPEAYPTEDDGEPIDVAPPALEAAGCLVAVTVEDGESGAPTLVLSVSFDGADKWITSSDGEQVPVELRLSGTVVWSTERAEADQPTG